MVALVANESGFEALVIGDNTLGKAFHPASRTDAVRLATDLIAKGHSIDMGIAQINNRTAARIGLTVDDTFDPCLAMAAAGRMMASTYRRIAPAAASTQHALAATLSTYNTGNTRRGFENGYVDRVYLAAARNAGTAMKPGPGAAVLATQSSPAADPPPVEPAPQPAWAVFDAAPSQAFVFQPAPKGR